jgi:hypothetical protein
MTKRKKREIGGQVTVDGAVLNWSIRSEPQWGTTAGNIGLRLTVVAEEGRARRELILEYPFETRQKNTSRFPDRPRINADELIADIRMAMAAGWHHNSRGRSFTLILEENDVRARSKK